MIIEQQEFTTLPTILPTQLECEWHGKWIAKIPLKPRSQQGMDLTFYIHEMVKNAFDAVMDHNRVTGDRRPFSIKVYVMDFPEFLFIVINDNGTGFKDLSPGEAKELTPETSIESIKKDQEPRHFGKDGAGLIETAKTVAALGGALYIFNNTDIGASVMMIFPKKVAKL